MSDSHESGGASFHMEMRRVSHHLRPATELVYPQMPTGVSKPYPGGQVRGDKIPTWLYIAAIRAELSQLLLMVNLYNRNVDNPDLPGAIPNQIHHCVIGLFRYQRAWAFNLEDDSPQRWPTLWEGRIWAQKLADRLWPQSEDPEACSVESVLSRAILPQTIASCEGILAIWPPIELGEGSSPDGATIPMHESTEEEVPDEQSKEGPEKVDYTDIVNTMRVKNQQLPAAIVEFMANKDSAPVSDVIKYAYKTSFNQNVVNTDAKREAFKEALGRTRRVLNAQRIPLAFKVGGGVIRKTVIPSRRRRA